MTYRIAFLLSLGWAACIYPQKPEYKVPDYLSVEYAARRTLFMSALLDVLRHSVHVRGPVRGNSVESRTGGWDDDGGEAARAGKIIALRCGYETGIAKIHADIAINVTSCPMKSLCKSCDETEGRAAVVENVSRRGERGLEMLRAATSPETGNFVDTGETVALNVHRHVQPRTLFGTAIIRMTAMQLWT